MAGIQLPWDSFPFEIRQEILLCALFNEQNDATLVKTVQQLSLICKDFRAELSFPIKARHRMLRNASNSVQRRTAQAYLRHMSQLADIINGGFDNQTDVDLVVPEVIRLAELGTTTILLPHIEEWEKVGRVLCWFDGLVHRLNLLEKTNDLPGPIREGSLTLNMCALAKAFFSEKLDRHRRLRWQDDEDEGKEGNEGGGGEKAEDDEEEDEHQDGEEEEMERNEEEVADEEEEETEQK